MEKKNLADAANTASKKLEAQLKTVWSVFLLAYIVCSITFFAGSGYVILSTLSLYAFLGVSVVCMLLRYRIKLDFYFLGLLCFTGIVTFGTFYSQSYSTVQDTLYYYVTMLVIVFCVMNYITSERDFVFVMRAIMLAGLSLSIYIFTYYGSEFFDLINMSARANFRFGSELLNANTVGITTAFSSIIAFGLLIGRKSNVLVKLMELVCFTVCGFFSLMSASKKATIIIILGCFCLLVFKKDSRKNVLKKIALFLLAVAVIAGLVYAIQNFKVFSVANARMQSFVSFLETGESSSVSDYERAKFIEEGLEHFEESPIFGKGTDASKYYFGKYSHCNYVEVLMNFGLVGFIIYYMGYLSVLKRFIKRLASGEDLSSTDVLAMLIFVIIVIVSFAAVIYYDRTYNILLASAAAYANIAVKNENEYEAEKQIAF